MSAWTLTPLAVGDQLERFASERIAGVQQGCTGQQPLRRRLAALCRGDRASLERRVGVVGHAAERFGELAVRSVQFAEPQRDRARDEVGLVAQRVQIGGPFEPRVGAGRVPLPLACRRLHLELAEPRARERQRRGDAPAARGGRGPGGTGRRRRSATGALRRRAGLLAGLARGVAGGRPPIGRRRPSSALGARRAVSGSAGVRDAGAWSSAQASPSSANAGAPRPANSQNQSTEP